MKRRAFLAAAGATAAVAGCSGDPEKSAAAPRRTVSLSTGAADWAALERGLQGRLIRPGDAAYNAAHKLYIPRFDRIRPAGIVYAEGTDDVRECLAFARRQGLRVAVRCGGHSYAGWSTGTGLVIDVSPLDGVRVTGGRASIGAGTRLIDVYDRLAEKGVSIPAGTCPTVGIAGLTLGGGLGTVSRAYGLTCDVLDTVRVVTADGQVRECAAGRDADLFWACRGGGGGNFGVAVDFTFRTHRIGDVTTFFLSWPWSRAGAVIRAWQGWAPRAPDEIWSSLHLDTKPGTGAPTVELAGLALADPETELRKLTAAAGADPASRSVRPGSYLDAMLVMAGCAGQSVPECHAGGSLPGQTAAGRFPRTQYTAKSHMAARPLPDSAVDGLVATFTRGNDVANRSVLLDALGGAVARRAPGDTAFPHRGALFSVQYLAGVDDRTWLRGVHDAMAAHIGTAAYVNYIDPELSGWQRAYYGANYDRLAKVKAAYDPERVFQFPQAIG